MNLRSMTPAQIDAIAFPLMAKEHAARVDFWNAKKKYEDALRAPSGSFAHRHVDERKRWMDEAEQRLNAAKQALQPYDEEFKRRGGWTRYPHTITSGQGHFHRGFNCSTCYPMTQYGYHHDYSGLTEKQLVDKVGSEACTVCFPWAPTTEAWSRTARAAADAKLAEKLAKWQKGRDVRAKKVANIEKRLSKPQRPYEDREYDLSTLVYARRELERWDAKRPA